MLEEGVCDVHFFPLNPQSPGFSFAVSNSDFVSLIAIAKAAAKCGIRLDLLLLSSDTQKSKQTLQALKCYMSASNQIAKALIDLCRFSFNLSSPLHKLASSLQTYFPQHRQLQMRGCGGIHSCLLMKIFHLEERRLAGWTKVVLFVSHIQRSTALCLSSLLSMLALRLSYPTSSLFASQNFAAFLPSSVAALRLLRCRCHSQVYSAHLLCHFC